MLQCDNVTKLFGDFAAIKDLSFNVEPGIIFGIAGPNGAGKTTLFNMVTGLNPATSGRIRFEGIDIHRKKPHTICWLGVARTFQIPDFFPGLTTFDNVKVGVKFGAKETGAVAENKALEILDFLELIGKKETLAGVLSLFNKKRLMIAMALATEPKMLLLDEPIGGLNPNEINQTMELIKKIHASGITIVLIEHVMQALMNLSDKIMILHHGEKLVEGPPKKVANDREVIEVYLGEECF